MVEQIKSLVEGGKATAGPPLGPALGPLGVPIGKVIALINERTKQYAGMMVPVTVKVDTKTKTFDVVVGSPPVSALIKKELKLEKGSANPKSEKIADMKIEQVIKIAMSKEGSMFVKNRRSAVKIVVGTCVSMGVMVEGKDPRDIMKDISAGIYDKKINAGKTELTAEEIAKLDAERERLAAELKKAREIEEKTAQDILTKLAGRSRAEIKVAMKQAGISAALINKLLPAEGAAEEKPVAGAPAAGAGTPAPAKSAEKKEEKK